MKNLNFRIPFLILVPLIFTICSLFFETFGQGTVVNTTFYSKSLKMNRNLQIYLPKGYDQQSTIKYPVIYFLHGATLNQNSYTEYFGILNELIGNNIISPAILVKPDGSIGPWAGSFYTNSELYGNFEDYIVYDLVEFIDSAYNTLKLREKRSIMGHSMGGLGAVKLALKHSDIFCAAASQSGGLDFNHLTDRVPQLLSENGGAPVSKYNPSAGLTTLLFYSMAGAYSPNIYNSPYPVDFPFDSLGNLIYTIWNKWQLHNPVLLARNYRPSNLALFFDCGKQDELGVYAFNTAFADSLKSMGLAYEFQSYNGGHIDQLLNRAPIAFKFLDSVMNKTVGIIEELPFQPATFYLYQNYPNPFNPSTKISWQSPVSSRQTVKIFNVLGKEVPTLIDEVKPAGSYEVRWNAVNLPSGIYFYQLKADSYTETKKLLLLK